MRRTRLAIFALFWMGWVVVLPFAHHHFVRAPRQETSVQCGGQLCNVSCVACQWESISTTQLAASPQASLPQADAEQPSQVASLPYRLFVVCYSPRAPPLI
jgi:hypothetical protein